MRHIKFTVDRKTPVFILRHLALEGDKAAIERLCELAHIGYEALQEHPTQKPDLQLATEIISIAAKLLTEGCKPINLVTQVTNKLQETSQVDRKTVSRYLKGDSRIARMIRIGIEARLK